MAKAVQNMPTSKKLWMQAARKEHDSKLRAKVLRRALEHLPREVELWKECVQLEEPEEAKQLLAMAVQCVPQAIELWQAYAKLETYQNARQVLNQARDANPTEFTIYVAAAKLEEAQGNKELVSKILRKAIKNLQRHQVKMSREGWLEQAIVAEQGDSMVTCQAIISETMHLGLEIDQFADEKERKKQARTIWLEDVDGCLREGAIGAAKAILTNAIAIDSGKKSLWMRAQQLEAEHGTTESLSKLLEAGV